MSPTNLAWMYVAVGILRFVLNIAAIAFLLTKRSKYPRPTNWALSGFGLMLLAQIFSQLFAVILGQIATANSFVIYNAIAALAGSLLNFAGLCLVIVAVYVDRHYDTNQPVGTAPHGQSTRVTDSNPYAV